MCVTERDTQREEEGDWWALHKSWRSHGEMQQRWLHRSGISKMSHPTVPRKTLDRLWKPHSAGQASWHPGSESLPSSCLTQLVHYASGPEYPHLENRVRVLCYTSCVASKRCYVWQNCQQWCKEFSCTKRILGLGNYGKGEPALSNWSLFPLWLQGVQRPTCKWDLWGKRSCVAGWGRQAVIFSVELMVTGSAGSTGHPGGPCSAP